MSCVSCLCTSIKDLRLFDFGSPQNMLSTNYELHTSREMNVTHDEVREEYASSGIAQLVLCIVMFRVCIC